MKMQRTILATLLAGAVVAFAAPASAQLAEQVPPPRLSWSFAGPFGHYDQAQLQRGFKIYREVCSACHSLNLLSFRNLAEPGGLGYSEAQVAQIASEYKIKDLDDKGNPI
jgi:ubiquinol-cytochrome c reductase cytochrome c1 subunit